MAIAGLVCGIVSTALSIFFSWTGIGQLVALALGIVGIALSVLASKELAVNGQPKGSATAGLVLSIIGCVFGAIFTYICVVCPCICYGESIFTILSMF